MRRPVIGVVVLVAGVAAVTPSLAGGTDTHRFTTVQLPGSSGSAEPRIAVAPDGTRWAVTSDRKGNELVLRSKYGVRAT